jgi:hypothetical protein
MFEEIIRTSKTGKLANLLDTPTPVLCAYGIFGALSFMVFHLVADREPSSILTISTLAQCLGISLLWVQVLSGKGAWGISAKSLLLDALAIGFRLCSTLFFEGYLPNSKDGDYVYQLCDVSSLIMLVLLLRKVLVNHADTYQATEDTLPVGPMLLGCLVLAAFLHGDMDDHPVCDTLWMAGLLTSVVAVLPQFWLIAKSGGRAGALTGHYIASMAISRFLGGVFAWMAWEHLSCVPYIGEFQHARWVIFGAHCFHVVLLLDFFYTYARSIAQKGLYGDLSFEGCCQV